MSRQLESTLLGLALALDPDGWASATGVALQLGQSLAVTQTELQLLEAEGYALHADEDYLWTLTDAGADLIEAAIDEARP